MVIIFYIILFILGACLGSFLCCQARRLHYNADHKIKKLDSTRSVCLHCHYQLKWYDNIPIFSWLILKGKCRKCKTKIGLAELLSELGTGLAFLAIGMSFDPTTTSVLSSTFNPFTPSPATHILNAATTTTTILSWTIFIITLIFTCVIAFLAIYDGLYGELPMKHLIIAIIIAIIILTLGTVLYLQSNPSSPDLIWRPLAAVAILGGLYLTLYLVSKGKWVGDGDWLLATALAIVLADPWPALITLFLANFIACFVMLPLVKQSKTHKIYFGPFLVIAFLITYML